MNGDPFPFKVFNFADVRSFRQDENGCRHIKEWISKGKFFGAPIAVEEAGDDIGLAAQNRLLCCGKGHVGKDYLDPELCREPASQFNAHPIHGAIFLLCLERWVVCLADKSNRTVRFQIIQLFRSQKLPFIRRIDECR